MLQEQMTFDSVENSPVETFIFGGNTSGDIFQYICAVVDDTENIELNTQKTADSISIFDSKEIWIKIGKKTQRLETNNALAFEYVPKINGATFSADKERAFFPLVGDTKAIEEAKAMIKRVYEDVRSKAKTEMFGCCNSYVQCSDAGYCLHLNDRDYWGCCYRKNLEAGRIFYGKNKNI